MGVDPAEVSGEGEVEEDLAAEFSDKEDEFGEGIGEKFDEKFDCPKAKFAKGDCHDLD